jgi:hypothetical protein
MCEYECEAGTQAQRWRGERTTAAAARSSRRAIMAASRQTFSMSAPE